MTSRFEMSVHRGVVDLPQGGPFLLLNARLDDGIDVLDPALCTVQQRLFPVVQSLKQAGFAAVPEVPESQFAAAVVFVHKSRAETLRLISAACLAAQGGRVIVDGSKGAGIESILKLCKAHFELGEVLSKAHGKIFSFAAKPAPASWSAPVEGPSGFVTGAGVFSAEKVDRGSALLMDSLPAVKGAVCDLGAGWGYLSHRLLARGDKVTRLDLIEADHTAARAAEVNLAETLASVLWGDALEAKGKYDVVLSNPPFHEGKQVCVNLGRAFLTAAARLTAPKGQFFFVANRHLPYENDLKELFAHIEVIADQGGFKVLQCRRPAPVAKR